MSRNEVAWKYGIYGAAVTTMFSIHLCLISADPIKPVQWIGWAIVGLGVGIITIFVAIDLCIRKKQTTLSSWYLTRPIIRDLAAGSIFTLLISLWIFESYERDYNLYLIQYFSPVILFTLAIVHYLLNRLADRLTNQETKRHLTALSELWNSAVNTLQPEEAKLLGGVILKGDLVQSDATSKRIMWLINHKLKEISVREENGMKDVLYLDPVTKRYWELTYPQSTAEENGPPLLTNISIERAWGRFNL